MYLKYFLFVFTVLVQNCFGYTYSNSKGSKKCDEKCAEAFARFVENYPWVIVLAVVIPLLACICCVVCVKLRDGSKTRPATQQAPAWKGFQGHHTQISYVNSPEIIIAPNDYFPDQYKSVCNKNNPNGFAKLHQINNSDTNANKNGFLISLEETKMSTDKLKDFTVGKIMDFGVQDSQNPHHQFEPWHVKSPTSR